MIVKMKKVFLIVLESAKEEALLKLRDLGVVHVEKENKTNETVNALVEKRTIFEKCITILSQIKAKKETLPAGAYEEAAKLADKVNGIQETIRRLEEEKERNRKDITNLIPWGDFNPDDVKILEQKGVYLKFYVLSKEQFEKLPDEIKYLLINQIKETRYIIALSLDKNKHFNIGSEQFFLPAAGIKQLSAEIKNNETKIAELQKELESLALKISTLKSGLEDLKTEIEMESVSAEMNTEERLSYLKGYVPEDKVTKLKETASAMQWALLIRDPEDGDEPPTLIKSPKLVSIIQPLFRFLDTTPGYKEADISTLFLAFFTIFVAMIVGDAGYGFIFLVLTIIMRIKLKKAPGQVFALLGLLSIATIVWGAITGNYFAAQNIQRLPVLRDLVIPQIANFDHGDTSAMIKQVSFILGMVHLTIGILISFIRKMPSLSAIADIGWLFVLYGMYFFAMSFVMGIKYEDPIVFCGITFNSMVVMGATINSLMLIILGIGFGLVLLFSEQNGKNVIKCALMGIAWSPLKALNSVSMFADLVSYIRLFAVGLAGFAVAESFNKMAGGLAGGVVGIILSAIILFVAHAFNMVLCLLSVIVHGVRLNMLEFGGKVGLEWSGHIYNPFRKKG